MANIEFSVFQLLLNYLPEIGGSKISKRNKVLLFLMKLKLALSFTSLGVFHSITRSTARRCFFDVLDCLTVTMNKFVYWPSRESVKDNMPEAFRRHYPNTSAIIDCTEIPTEMPKKIERRNFMYSQYKGGYTLKFLISCTPLGLIYYMSKSYGGRASDCFITNDCGFIDLIEPGDVILADKGFPSIQADVEGKNAVFVMPPFFVSTSVYTRTSN